MIWALACHQTVASNKPASPLNKLGIIMPIHFSQVLTDRNEEIKNWCYHFYHQRSSTKSSLSCMIQKTVIQIKNSLSFECILSDTTAYVSWSASITKRFVRAFNTWNVRNKRIIWKQNYLTLLEIVQHLFDQRIYFYYYIYRFPLKESSKVQYLVYRNWIEDTRRNH